MRRETVFQRPTMSGPDRSVHSTRGSDEHCSPELRPGGPTTTRHAMLFLHGSFEGGSLSLKFCALAVATAVVGLLLLLLAPQAQAQLLPPETVAARQQVWPPPWPALTQTASPNPAVVGQPVTFTITVVNDSSYAGDRVFGILPEGATLAALPTQTTPNGGCEVNPAGLITGDSSSQYFLCSLSPIPAGGTATATLTLIPTAPGLLTNTVQDFVGQQVQTTVEVLPTAEEPALIPPANQQYTAPRFPSVPAYAGQTGTPNDLWGCFGTSP